MRTSGAARDNCVARGTANQFDALIWWYGTTQHSPARECVSGRQDELNRRLKLDLLITAGNARARALAVANGSDPGSYLIKPSFRNSHAAVCHRRNQRMLHVSSTSGAYKSASRFALFPIRERRVLLAHSNFKILLFLTAYHSMWAHDNFPPIINELFDSRKYRMPAFANNRSPGSEVVFVNTRVSNDGRWYNMRQCFLFIHESLRILIPYRVFQHALAFRFFNLLPPPLETVVSYQ